MPQGSVTTSLLIANQYRTTQFSLGSLVGSLCAGQGSGAGQQASMEGMRFTQSKTEQALLSSTLNWAPLALSADGNTLAIGIPTLVGSVAIYTRSGVTWTLQATVTPTGNIGNSQMGSSVALSADGNTLATGANQDNVGVGAVWIFTRTAGVWSQQAKLVGTGNVGNPLQGISTSLSADGNTVAFGGVSDDSSTGAVWVFIRSAGSWSQQGSKLVGSNGVGYQQGRSVSLSADGNTLAFGGNVGAGKAWIFTRSGVTWTEQAELFGTGAVGNANQGFSIALSSDGDTVAVSGYLDNTNVGAVWIFVRSGGSWSQQGSKLVPNDSVGAARFGISIGISADGNILLAGGSTNNSNNGGNWIFTRTNTTWSQDGSGFIGTTDPSASAERRGTAVALSKNGNVAVSRGFDPAPSPDVQYIWVFV
jgi:hypothetical protein